MRCRFCDTEIADRAFICYRCGKATSDPRVAAPPQRGSKWPGLLGLAGAAAAVAVALDRGLDGAPLWAAWAIEAGAALAVALRLWRR